MDSKELLSAMSKAISLAKQLKEAADKTKDPEIASSVADLSLELANANLQLAEVVNENAELRAELDALKRRAEAVENLEFQEDGYYYKAGDEIPFCPHCYEAENRAIHLSKSPAVSSFVYSCQTCGNDYS